MLLPSTLRMAKASTRAKSGLTVDDIGVKAIDDTTLEITLEGPRGYFALRWHTAFASPQGNCRSMARKWTEAENIVTNGPLEVDHLGTRSSDGPSATTIPFSIACCASASARLSTPKQLSAYEANEVIEQLHLWVKLSAEGRCTAQEINQFSLTGTFYLTPSYSMPLSTSRKRARVVAHAIDRDNRGDSFAGYRPTSLHLCAAGFTRSHRSSQVRFAVSRQINPHDPFRYSMRATKLAWKSPSPIVRMY